MPITQEPDTVSGNGSKRKDPFAAVHWGGLDMPACGQSGDLQCSTSPLDTTCGNCRKHVPAAFTEGGRFGIVNWIRMAWGGSEEHAVLYREWAAHHEPGIIIPRQSKRPACRHGIKGHPRGCQCRPCLWIAQGHCMPTPGAIDGHLAELTATLEELSTSFTTAQTQSNATRGHAWRLLVHLFNLAIDLEAAKMITAPLAWRTASTEYGSVATCLFLADWCRQLRTSLLRTEPVNVGQ